MQNVGISTHLRDCKDDFLEHWEAATEDGIVTATEIIDLTPYITQQAGLIDEQDDCVRLSLTLLKVGTASRDTQQRIRTFERLHGPIDLDSARKTRPMDGTPPDAA